jgi:Flp pilus assembly protein TadG
MTRRLFRDGRGSAAVEMALVSPMLLILMMGAVELGNYFYSQHILVKGVRDGAIYAARQDIATNYDCSAGTPTVPSTVVTNTKQLVRTGQLTGGTDRLPNWTSGSTSFTVTVSCVTAAGGTTLGGMYTSNGGKVPVVTVTAQLPYRSVLGRMGFDATSLDLYATEQTAATGV